MPIEPAGPDRDTDVQGAAPDRDGPSERVGRAIDALASCRLCPRACGVNRLVDETGFCGVGRRAVVASAFAHHGEEDCLRGTGGSGTIFFAGCNLKCAFCQNHDIAWHASGRPLADVEIARLMLQLEDRGCHNVNLVTPSHVVPQVLEALAAARALGLALPVVWNSSGYDAVESLRMLDGAVDVYMPDFKVWSPAAARRYLRAPDYPAVARRALVEMHHQVGDLRISSEGLASRGLLVRHLVLPHDAAGTRSVARFLAREVSPCTFVNLMGQYRPDGWVGVGGRYAELDRAVSYEELAAARRDAAAEGLSRFDERAV